MIADLHLTPNLGPSLWTSANWVFRHGVEFASRDLTQDSRATPGAAGTALAFPLICRHKTVGALVGLDPDPSTAAPALGAALVAAACTVLEPAAIALDNATALQKAEALSVTDDLTRPYNSRYLNQALRRETKRASRSGRPLSLLFLDLDGFKMVNDNHGHLAGSKALAETAEIVRAVPVKRHRGQVRGTNSPDSAGYGPGRRIFGGGAHSRPGGRGSIPGLGRPFGAFNRVHRGCHSAGFRPDAEELLRAADAATIPGEGVRQERDTSICG